MIIRKASIADVSILLAIIRKSFLEVAEKFELTIDNCPKSPAFYTTERLKGDFEKGLTYYILEEDGRECGCAALERAGADKYYLERLAVLPQHRRKGFGETLVRYIFEQARKVGAERLEIGIIAEQKELKKWYGKFGFVEKYTKRFEHLPFVVAFMSVELS